MLTRSICVVGTVVGDVAQLRPAAPAASELSPSAAGAASAAAAAGSGASHVRLVDIDAGGARVGRQPETVGRGDDDERRRRRQLAQQHGVDEQQRQQQRRQLRVHGRRQSFLRDMRSNNAPVATVGRGFIGLSSGAAVRRMRIDNDAAALRPGSTTANAEFD